VQQRRLAAAAGQHERAQRLQLRLGLVDPALQLRGVRHDAGERSAAAFGSEVGADLEQGVLDRLQAAVEVWDQGLAAQQAEERVQLVDGAVGLDARMFLGDAAVAEQAGLTVVAGARVDGHLGRLGPIARSGRRGCVQPRGRRRGARSMGAPASQSSAAGRRAA
jgi:hypothetical protein